MIKTNETKIFGSESEVDDYIDSLGYYYMIFPTILCLISFIGIIFTMGLPPKDSIFFFWFLLLGGISISIFVVQGRDRSNLAIKTRIYSTATKRDIYGEFSLLHGFIDTVPRYYYFVKSDNGFVINNVDARHTRLIETTKTEPCIIKWPWNENNKKNELYVPPNTIKNMKVYKVDLQTI